eukprot:15067370-Alexandrium_andersonii.AAC.1
MARDGNMTSQKTAATSSRSQDLHGARRAAPDTRITSYLTPLTMARPAYTVLHHDRRHPRLPARPPQCVGGAGTGPGCHPQGQDDLRPSLEDPHGMEQQRG